MKWHSISCQEEDEAAEGEGSELWGSVEAVCSLLLEGLVYQTAEMQIREVKRERDEEWKSRCMGLVEPLDCSCGIIKQCSVAHSVYFHPNLTESCWEPSPTWTRQARCVFFYFWTRFDPDAVDVIWNAEFVWPCHAKSHMNICCLESNQCVKKKVSKSNTWVKLKISF